MADLSITKQAAAQRQIDAAIRMLFLHGEDFIAIHTVAAAARTILNDLAEARASARRTIRALSLSSCIGTIMDSTRQTLPLNH